MAAILQSFGNLLGPKRVIPTGKLRIDWSHPLAQGLVGCWLPGVMGGIDLSGTCPDLTLLTTMNHAIDMRAEGPASVGGTTNGGTIWAGIAPPAYKGWNNFSTYYRGSLTQGTPNSFNYLFYIGYDTSGGSPFQVVGVGDGTNGNALTTVNTIWNKAGTFLNGTGVNFVTPGNPVSCLGTFVVNGNNILYRNGQQVASDSWGGAGQAQTSATTQINIGGWSQFGPRYASVDTYMACAWNRTLSASEAQWLDADPYCFLLSDEGEMPGLFLAGGGGGSGTVALVGVSSTGNVGILAVIDITSLVGVQDAGSAGSLTPGDTTLLLGVSATGSAGAPTPGNSPLLPGVAATGTPGSLALNNTLPLLGVSAASSAGPFIPAWLKGLTGVSSTVSNQAFFNAIALGLLGVQATGSATTFAGFPVVSTLQGVLSTTALGSWGISTTGGLVLPPGPMPTTTDYKLKGIDEPHFRIAASAVGMYANGNYVYVGSTPDGGTYRLQLLGMKTPSLHQVTIEQFSEAVQTDNVGLPSFPQYALLNNPKVNMLSRVPGTPMFEAILHWYSGSNLPNYPANGVSMTPLTRDQ